MACLYIPRKKSVKLFSCAALFITSSLFFDKAFYFRSICQAANTHVLEDESQEYRNVLSFYLDRKLRDDEDLSFSVK